MDTEEKNASPPSSADVLTERTNAEKKNVVFATLKGIGLGLVIGNAAGFAGSLTGEGITTVITKIMKIPHTRTPMRGHAEFAALGGALGAAWLGYISYRDAATDKSEIDANATRGR